MRRGAVGLGLAGNTVVAEEPLPLRPPAEGDATHLGM